MFRRFRVRIGVGLTAALVVLCSAGLLGLAPSSAFAQTTASTQEAGQGQITTDMFVSTSYTYNFNRPAHSDSLADNRFRVFDFDDNAIKVDVVELVMQKAASEPGETGFRLDLTAGSSIPRIAASSGLFRGPQAALGEDFDLQQGIVTWVAPIGKGLRVDFGKMVSPLGYEVIDGYDGYNDNYSRSFLFGYAIPFAHTGLRAGYTFNSRVSASMMVVNGWDNVRDNNTSKTIQGQLVLAPAAGVTLYANAISGPEQTGNDKNNRTVLDGSAILKASDRVTLGLNTDYGSEQNAVPADNGGTAAFKDAAWFGLAGYVRLGLSDRAALCLRGEHFDDSDGARTGIGQTLQEFTITPEFRPSTNLTLRTDLRIDRSDRAVFPKRTDAGFTDQKTQTTLALNAIFAF